MSTVVTVWDYSGGNFAMRIAEDFPLQEDMMKMVDETYYYAIATCHTQDAESRYRISSAIKEMRTKLGNRKTVQQVFIGNSEEHVVFINPRIELFEAYGELFIEVYASMIRRSSEVSQRRVMSVGR